MGKGGDSGRVEWKGRPLFSGFAVKTFPLHFRHFPRWNRCSHWCDRSSLHTARLRHGACKWGHTLIVSVQNKQTIKQCGDISIKMVKILLLQQHLLLEKRANRQSCTNCRLCSSRTPCLEATSKIHDTRTCLHGDICYFSHCTLTMTASHSTEVVWNGNQVIRHVFVMLFVYHPLVHLQVTTSETGMHYYNSSSIYRVNVSCVWCLQDGVVDERVDLIAPVAIVLKTFEVDD